MIKTVSQKLSTIRENLFGSPIPSPHLDLSRAGASFDHHRSTPVGGELGSEADTASSAPSWGQEIQSRCGESICFTVGLVHCDTTHGANTARVEALTSAALEATGRRVLLVSPWKKGGPVADGLTPLPEPFLADHITCYQENPFVHFGLGVDENARVTGAISVLLRRLATFKKSFQLVILDLGRMDQPLAMSLASWCDANYLILGESNPAQDRRLNHGLRAWQSTQLKLQGCMVHEVESSMAGEAL